MAASRTPREAVGDGAMAAFCREHHPRLVGLLALYVGDRHVAEELAQETLVRVCQQWHQVSRMTAPSAWTSKVAMHLASSWWRRRSAERRARIRHGGDPDVAPGHDPDAEARADAVRRAVAALPERQRRAIVLRFYADLSVAEVADAMHCPPGTVTSLTHRAMATLRDHEHLRGLRDLPDADELEEVEHRGR